MTTQGKKKCFKDEGKGLKANVDTSQYWKVCLLGIFGIIWEIKLSFMSVITRGFALKRFGLTHQIFSPNSGAAWLKIAPTESLTSAFRLQVA